MDVWNILVLNVKEKNQLSLPQILICKITVSCIMTYLEIFDNVNLVFCISCYWIAINLFKWFS